MRRFALATVAFLSLVLPLAAQDYNFGERPDRIDRHQSVPVYVPDCDDQSVQRTLRRHFRQTERAYWPTNLRINDIVEIRETAYRPTNRDIIPRRYCNGVALMSDDRKRVIDYSVIEHAGIIGLSWGVQWCVRGLDRHNTYAPDCLMARP